MNSPYLFVYAKNLYFHIEITKERKEKVRKTTEHDHIKYNILQVKMNARRIFSINLKSKDLTRPSFCFLPIKSFKC